MNKKNGKMVKCACGCGRERYVVPSRIRKGCGKYYNNECRLKHKASNSTDRETEKKRLEEGFNPTLQNMLLMKWRAHES